MIGIGHYISARSMIGAPGQWNGALLDIDMRSGTGFASGSPRTIAGTSGPYPTLGTFTRASAADWLNSAGDGLATQAASGVLRRDARGALIEPAQTNELPNSDFVGAQTTAEAGNSTGTAPTGMLGLGTANGTTLAITGRGTENGMPYVDVNLSGTASSSVGRSFILNANAAIIASVGQTWTGVLYYRNIAGDMTGLTSLAIRITERNTGGATASVNSQGTLPAPTSTTLQRVSFTRTLNDAATDRVQLSFVFSQNNGFTINNTTRIYFPHLSQGSFVWSPIRTGVGASATRPGDVWTAPISLGANWSAVIIARMPSTATNTTDRLINIGADANDTIAIRRETGGLLLPFAVTGGTPASGASVTAPALGARFAMSLRRSGTTLATAIDGGAVVSASPTMTGVAPTTVRIGSSFTGDQWGSFIERVIIFPSAVDDATLQTYSNLATWGG